MNANQLKCGQIIKYKGKSRMVMGFSGKTLYRKDPSRSKRLLTFPEKVHLNTREGTVVVNYEDVVDISEYEKPKF